MSKKALTPRITETSEKFYEENFSSLTSGATYVLELFPRLHQYIVSGLRRVFTTAELKLMVDAFNTLALTPGLAGQHVLAEIEDAIYVEKLDEKWGVDVDSFLPKLRSLDRTHAACLEIHLKGFWAQFSQYGIPLDEWIDTSF